MRQSRSRIHRQLVSLQGGARRKRSPGQLPPGDRLTEKVCCHMGNYLFFLFAFAVGLAFGAVPLPAISMTMGSIAVRPV